MRVRQEPTMSWQDVPDIISPEDLSKILGCGIATARNKFDETNFPIIKNMGNLIKTDKETVKLYLQGKDYMEYTAKTVSNKIQKEILETLQEINDIIQNPIAWNSNLKTRVLI